MRIINDFEGANADVISEGAHVAQVAIRPDTNAHDKQWFAFQVEGASSGLIEIVNAGETSYPDAWEGYRACASSDLIRWTRVPTEFDGDVLRIEHRPEGRGLTYAYFAPYPLRRAARLVNRVRRAPHARADVVGKSVLGRDLHLLTFGWPQDDDDDRHLWVIARQHPGETQAEWFAEGLIERLLNRRDTVTQRVLDKAVVHVVSNMNPDGSALGNLRTNAAGVNLNRTWSAPSDETSPEVACIRARMEELGVDFLLDVHADERNPYCFLAGCEGNPSYSSRTRRLENMFEQSLVVFDEDFQDEYGYERDEPGGGDLRTAGNWVGETFDCLSFTLEMPFKDAANHPDPERGWTPERAKKLGRAALNSILVCLDELR